MKDHLLTALAWFVILLAGFLYSSGYSLPKKQRDKFHGKIDRFFEPPPRGPGEN